MAVIFKGSSGNQVINSLNPKKRTQIKQLVIKHKASMEHFMGKVPVMHGTVGGFVSANGFLSQSRWACCN